MPAGPIQLAAQESARMAGATTAAAIVSKAEERPFASPHYWAAFVAYGAVL